MPLTEFDIIQQYFSNINFGHSDIVACGIGDDAAVLSLGQLASYGQYLHVSADSLNEGTHFLANACPEDLGFKSLAVNISDILAMGAKPLAFTLCLSLPSVNLEWVSKFSRGLADAARQYQVSLIGGDTTRGSHSISIQVFGVSSRTGLLRSGAKAGDYIAVTGTLGDSAAGLQYILDPELSDKADPELIPHIQYLRKRCTRPTPRESVINFDLEGIHAAIDISDGLIPDLEHICRASKLEAVIDPELIPLSAQIQAVESKPLLKALVGGEDYELCMAVSPGVWEKLQLQALQSNVQISKIGHFKKTDKQKNNNDDFFVKIRGWSHQDIIDLKNHGFQHFVSEKNE